MSDFFWQKLNYLIGLIAIAVLFGLTAFASNLEIKDLDLWLHLRTGQYIVEHKVVPDHDVLSCSIAGKPWVNHEWLFQVILYLVKEAWGFDGLITMQVLVVCMTFLILLVLAYHRDRQGLAVFCLLLVMLVYQSRFTIRPDIFSLLFFAINMYVLALHLDKRAALWVLGFVQLLWVNMHGFFIFAPILAAVGIASEGIKRKIPLPYEWNSIGRLNDGEFKRLIQIFVVLVLASLCNPMFIEGAVYPLKVLFQASGESKIFFNHIYELEKPFKRGLFSGDTYYRILILISGFSFFFNRRKIDISVFFFWLVFLLFSLAAIRNLIYFSCAAYLVVMVNSLDIKSENILPLRFVSNKFKEVTAIIFKCILIFWMLNYGLQICDRGYFDYDTYERKSEYGGVSKRSYPYKAADFLVEHKIKGNFFNDFNSGAYLIGRASPNVKVFIDGRTEVYGAAFFKDYQKIWQAGSKKEFNEAQAKYDLNGAFLNNANQYIPIPVIKLFYGLKNWKLVYFNDDGMIFLKNIPQHQSVINKFAIDLRKWQPPQLDLQRLGSRSVYPFQYINRARMLIALRFDDAAYKELSAALKVSPDAPEIYRLLGDINARQKQYRKAFENFRIGCMLDPNNRHTRLRLAWSYEKLKDYKNALTQYERLLALNPKDDKIRNIIKKLNQKLKKKA